MSARRIKVSDLREIVRRIRASESDRRVARELGLSRNTVSKYRAWAREQGFLDSKDLPELKHVEDRRAATIGVKESGPTSIVEPYREFVEEKRAKGVEIRALHALLRERGFAGSYSAVKRFVARFEEREPEKFLRIETAPAEEAQVDFGYAGEVYDAHCGRKRKAWIFVMTLSYSRHQFVQAVFDQSVETWTALHVRALEHFGGVPGRIVVDNLKAAIVRAVLHDPEIQRSYRELAEHYGFLISPCRPRTPRHKGKVESGVHYVKRNALAGREFTNLESMNAHLTKWVNEVAGIRQHGTVYEQPLARFEREKDELRTLPAERFEVRSCSGKGRFPGDLRAHAHRLASRDRRTH